MALQTKLKYNYGLELNEAYCKITRYEWTSNELMAQVTCFYNENARRMNNGVFEILTFNFKDIDTVSLSILYEMIKQTPEFTGSIDV